MGFYHLLRALVNSIVSTRLKRVESLPANLAGITLTDGGGAWTKGAYAEIIATTTKDYWLKQIVVYSVAIAVIDTEHEVDIAIGAAGSEAVIAAAPIYVFDENLQDRSPGCRVKIPKGSRIAARQANSAGGGTTLVAKVIVETS